MALQLHLPVMRPRRRGECVGHQGPCPYVSCRNHLLFDVMEDGTLEVMNREVVEVYGRALRETQDVPDGWSDAVLEALQRMPETCALDVADDEAWRRQDEFANYADVGTLIGCGRERVRQICDAALERMRDALARDTRRARDEDED